MAHTHAQTAAQRAPPSSASNYQGNRPQDIGPHKGSLRKRVWLRAERNRLRPTTPSETPTPREQPAPVQSRGRKRKHPTGHALEGDPDPDAKRQRTPPLRPTEDAFGEPAIDSGAHKHTDPVAFWVKEGHWPEEQGWPEETSETHFTIDRLPFTRKKSSSNLPRKRSNSATSTTPSDQKPREEESAPYRDQRYETLLKVKGSYMTKDEIGVDSASQALCQSLLEKKQPVPGDTLFRGDVFETTCRKIHNKNEARVVQDISRGQSTSQQLQYSDRDGEYQEPCSSRNDSTLRWWLKPMRKN